MTGGQDERLTDQLPETLPLFPLSGVLLLPGGHLPLHIFEQRYRAMTRDALEGNRMIGMIQPTDADAAGEKPPVYRTGCAGRITASSRTGDGRYELTLTGVCRFDVVGELPLLDGYRRALADYAPYRGDLDEHSANGIERDRLLPLLRAYLDLLDISANWEAVERTPDAQLVNLISVICPFLPVEKQALLESPTVLDRSRLLITLIDMATHAQGIEGSERTQ